MDKFVMYVITRRKQLGYSQKEFAMLMGVNDRTVQRWEGNECSMSVKQLEKAFKVLDVKQVILVPGEGVINFG